MELEEVEQQEFKEKDKYCRVCNTVLPANKFQKVDAAGTRRSRCIDCNNKINESRRLGISVEQYTDEYLFNDVCFVCGADRTVTYRDVNGVAVGKCCRKCLHLLRVTDRAQLIQILAVVLDRFPFLTDWLRANKRSIFPEDLFE